MLDFKMMRDKPDFLKINLERRGINNPWNDLNGKMDLEQFFCLQKEQSQKLNEIEQSRTKLNRWSEEFHKLKKIGGDTVLLSKQIESEKSKLSCEEKSFSEKQEILISAALRLPNLLDPSVPQGKNSEDNITIRTAGEIRKFDFEARAHWEIGESLGILDFVSAGKISGSRFAVLKGMGASLERALISFMLDLHIKKHGYTEIFAPYLVNEKSMEGTGQLPKFKEELFKMESDNLYLIPTAEVSVTNLHRDDVFEEADLPKKYVSYSACFRREAGSYGKDTKGLIRNHQFNKVELVWFSTPEQSFANLEKLTQDAEDVLKEIGIPYRVVALCSGDIGFASAKTYDIEVWMPGEKRWREISSCSCFTDFQARRMNIKYKSESGKRDYLHTLNGSGVAVGRLFASVLENFQEKDGSVLIPSVLKPYIKEESIGL